MERVAQFGNEHVSDLAVHPTIPGLLAVGAVDGSVHRYAQFTREKTWSTSISNPRVSWVEDKILVWGSQSEGFVLNEDGSTVSFEISANSDLALAGSRLLVVSANAGLFSYQLSSAQPVLREKLRNIDGYRSIIASSSGAIALTGGSRIFFQLRADAPWQEVERTCTAISFSPDGRRLAIVERRQDVATLSLLAVTDRGVDVDNRAPSFPLLATSVAQLQWCTDGAALIVVGGDGELEVRDASTGQLTFSRHVSGLVRCYPQENVLVTASPKGLHYFQWAPSPSRLWITRRNGSATPDKLEIVGKQPMSRGDEILFFVDDPLLRPAALYEIASGLHTNEDADPPNPIVGVLRAALPQPTDQAIESERELVTRLANVTPLRDTRALSVHTATVQLLRNLYRDDTATLSRIEEFVDTSDSTVTSGSSFSDSDVMPKSAIGAAPAASRLQPALQPLRELFERYAGVVSCIDIALVARLGARNDIISARITATSKQPTEIREERNGWISLRTGLPIDQFGELLAQLSHGSLEIDGRRYSFLIADGALFGGFRTNTRGLGTPVRPVAYATCSGGPISSVLREREFFHWRDHQLPVDSSFFDLTNLIERLELRQPLQGDSDHRQVHVEFELPLDLRLLAIDASHFSISLRLAGQHATKVPLLVKVRDASSRETGSYTVEVGDSPVQVDWPHTGRNDTRVSVRVSDSAMLLMDESFEAHDAKKHAALTAFAEASAEHPDEPAFSTAVVRGDALTIGATPRVLGLLGTGAEADVYVVRDRFGREVAAKVFYESKRVPEHIFAHAVGMARVPHPAVATLYSVENVVDHDGRSVPAILMERLKGEDLDQRLGREVSLDEVIKWGRTILDVFESMHSVGHFHPDPHAGNFFVTEQGLRVYDLLYSPSAEQRSTRTKESLRVANARHVRGLIEALLDRLPASEHVHVASRMFTARTRNVDLALETIRVAFGEAIEFIVAKARGHGRDTPDGS